MLIVGDCKYKIKMSAGKRLAKRSVIGTRVGAPWKENGLYQPGVIVGSKNPEEHKMSFFHNCHTGITSSSRFIVRFENGEIREFSESELIGSGFGSIHNLKLRSGQKTFVTYNGREVSGTVVFHQPQKDEVLINVLPQIGSPEIPFDVTRKLDEVRLLESRKSARLQEQDFDFARLADVADRKRNQQTSSIDVPRTSNMSRKRRPSSGFQPLMSTSATSQGDDDVMEDECAAAMVLMSLSCSPHSPHWENNGMASSSWSSSSSSGASSWLSTTHGQAGSSSYPGENTFNNCSPSPTSSDDGIESDSGEWEEPKRKKTKILFKCTWPGCVMMKESCFEIEAHVRYAHLGPKNDGSGEREEEFYYTELEIADLSPSLSSSGSSGSSSVGMAFSPTLSHMDMVRPPSEDPEYKLSQVQLQRKSPNGNTHLSAKKRLSPKSSPVRRPRGDTKKCRKVYGMERREAWCTQCKWKKACTRFGDYEAK